MSTLRVNRIEPRTGDTVEIVGFGGGGKVLQYKYMTQSTEIVSTSSDWIDTGFDLDFTPTSNTSALKITASLKVEGYMDNSIRSSKTNLRLMRDATNIYQIERGYYRNMSNSTNNRGLLGWIDMNWIDMPNSTSTINYKVQFQNGNTNSTVFESSSPALFEITEIEL